MISMSNTTRKNVKEKNEEKEEDSLKPFKVYFVGNKEVLSKKRIGKQLIIETILTSKPYSTYYNQFKVDDEQLKHYIDQLIILDPQKKYAQPVTSNQIYGWYPTSLVQKDKRINYSMHTSTFVREHLMNYVKIRD